MEEIRRDIVAGLGFCVILIGITLVFVEVVYGAGLAPGKGGSAGLCSGRTGGTRGPCNHRPVPMPPSSSHTMFSGFFLVILGAPLLIRLVDRAARR